MSRTPPAVVLGGGVTALSVARSLHRAGATVYVLDRPDSPARWSRAVDRFVGVAGEDAQEQMLAWLRTAGLGAFVAAGADDGVELLARHRADLAEQGYHPVEADQDVLAAMLNKLRTYELAREHGIAAPRVLPLADADAVEDAIEQVEFPCVLKPSESYVFARRASSGAKVLFVTNGEELRQEWARLSALGVEVFLTEVIYGESDEFVSYHGYIGEHGESLVDFTKRKLRQCPIGFGIGTYHETTRDPEVAALALRFIRAVGLRGVGNVEFKRKAATGELVLIECNARFTLSNELIRAAGADLARMAYKRALALPTERIESYRVGLHLWDPARDLRAFSEYRRQGELSTLGWAKSLMHRQVLPAFRFGDPLPAVARAASMARHSRSSGPEVRQAPSTRSAESERQVVGRPSKRLRLERLAKGG